MHSWISPSVPRLSGRGGPTRVFDTASQSLMVAAAGNHAQVYVCGVTPYDATHVGHAATYLAYDILIRGWLDEGKEVTYASNVTDVDDPLLERATATGVDWVELAREQTMLFASDMHQLRVIAPDVYRGAVESIPDVVQAITTMLEQGLAYRVPIEAGAGGLHPDMGDLYAALSDDSGLGGICHLDEATMDVFFAERGGDPKRHGKRHRRDPLLWRRERPGEPAWDGGVLGTGRPGWHIECAVIALEGLGSGYDVQGGGLDLIYPHHEMSASHLRALQAQAPRVHMHTGEVAYEGHKMSKSRGNLVFVSQLIAAGIDPMAIRLALLAHHYRSSWEWTSLDIDAAQKRLSRWRLACARAQAPDSELVIARIRAAISEDLNTPEALAAVDEWAAIEGGDAVAAGRVAQAIDALLGVI